MVKRRLKKMAKKVKEFTVGKGQRITNIFGTFDKNEDGAYIEYPTFSASSLRLAYREGLEVASA